MTGARDAALASAMLNVLATHLSDSGRVARARALRADDAVMWVRVAPGRLLGSVQGSAPTPYTVEWTVAPMDDAAEEARRAAPADDPQRSRALVPFPADVRAVCDCADPEPVCKHAVAVLLELAEQVSGDVGVLAELRGVAYDAVLDEDARARRREAQDTTAEIIPFPARPAMRSTEDRRRGTAGRTAEVRALDPLRDVLAAPDGAAPPDGPFGIPHLPPPATTEALIDVVLIDVLHTVDALGDG